METCPCGSGSEYDVCCAPLHRGNRAAPAPEILMRARYAAFVKGDIGFLRRTIEPSQQQSFDEEAARKWSSEAAWKGLEIVSTERGGMDDETGRVEFIARYEIDGKDMNHHEVARFRKEDGIWYFADGRIVGVDPYVREEPKVGRNDPCPCGSGRKFKKCCGK